MKQQLRSGIPSEWDYKRLIESDDFREMEFFGEKLYRFSRQELMMMQLRAISSRNIGTQNPGFLSTIMSGAMIPEQDLLPYTGYFSRPTYHICALTSSGSKSHVHSSAKSRVRRHLHSCHRP